uniref:MATH domain-containing protein n=1 Tax=Oryza glaberrima TaxID=4538 RepID=I1QUP2_ORYGL
MRRPIHRRTTRASAAAAAATGSTSTIFAGAMRYELKIVEYSRTKAVPNGCSMKYPAFTAAGHTWHVGYFPNGVIGAEEAEADYVAFFLYLNDNDAAEEAVKAQAIFSLLDIEGNPVSSYTFTTVLVNFSEKKYWVTRTSSRGNLWRIHCISRTIASASG